MKQIVFFSTLFLLITMYSCDKDQEANIQKSKGKSSLKFAQTAPSSAGVNAVDFSLIKASTNDNYLHASVEYTGGNKAHAFSLTWDGTVKNENDLKIIQLNVYHLTSDDNGNQTIKDSLNISLEELNISADLLSDPTLRLDVVNTTNIENHLLVTPCINVNTPIVTEPYVHYFNYKLKVVKAECNEIGSFSNFWLKSNSPDSVQYFIPLEIDDAVTYQPKVNELVNVKLQYTTTEGVEGIEDCEFIGKNDVVAIKIKEIKLINE